MSQRIWNIGIVDMVCIILLCFLYFILYQGAHGDRFIENTALVLMFFCAVVILSTTASLLHAMIYSIPGYREPNFGASYYNRRRQELHNHIKKSIRATKPPKLIPFEAATKNLNIKDLILLHDSMMSLNQFMMSHGTSQQLYFNPHLYDCRFNERHENIIERDNTTYPVWQNGSSIFSDSLNPPRETKCNNCSEKIKPSTEHYCNQSINSCKDCSNIPCTCKTLNNDKICKTCKNISELCICNTIKSDNSENVTIPIDEVIHQSFNIVAMDSLNYNSLGYDIPKSVRIRNQLQSSSSSTNNNMSDIVEYMTPIIRNTNEITIQNTETSNKEPNPYAGPLIPPPCDYCMEHMTICTHNSNFDYQNMSEITINTDINNLDTKSESEAEEIKIIPLCKSCSTNDEVIIQSNSSSSSRNPSVSTSNIFTGVLSEISSYVSERLESFKTNNIMSPVTTL